MAKLSAYATISRQEIALVLISVGVPVDRAAAGSMKWMRILINAIGIETATFRVVVYIWRDNPKGGQDFLIHKVSWSHTTTHHSQ